ncbi:carboxypeptidase regulatory-like domain-containing protein [Roseimaritima ulvae]|uniref:Carboxypeptidase regulatory-like domain-containing protein n=1 Tax=Roseimaritima ulvae TaxID=980254 RepID=A0A5B9R3D7_9BACT|nr:carboxypeptidase regulatory-like domain-containing protein [Roseimaritima ulvae]QEG40841.1 hypothetical protein UC8_28590 [Roseimaritima ulvae]
MTNRIIKALLPRRSHRPSATLLAALLLIPLAGCGGTVGPMSGIVRFDDGSPVTAGSIEFRSLPDQARFASRIAPDGSFEPADQDGQVGLPPGSYEVVVVQIVLTEDLTHDAHTHGNTVPRRYADYYTSGLKVDIATDQSEPVEVILETE